MLCPGCGEDNPSTATTCGGCGRALATGEQDSTVAVETGWTDFAPSAGAETTLSPGQLLGGRYEILELLGQGGMGAVYKARDREVDRIVALKIIRPELAGSPEILQRFRQELILARQITHRNVIRIFDLGVADGLRFISMEFIEGREVADLLKERGKFSPQEAAGIVRQVCEGLAAAHAEQVIHRDLKPQNLMLDASGKISIMDFGIAGSSLQPSSGAAGGREPEAEAAGMTQAGRLLGTPAYMSPEQARGEKLDSRSDLYTLGVIFYELLSGQVPHRADSMAETLRRRIEERPVAPVEADPSIPKELNAIVLKCLEPDPQARYQTASEFLRDLDAWLYPRSWIYTWRGVAAGVAVLALSAAALVYWQKSMAPQQPRKAVKLLVADFRNTTSDSRFNGTLEPAFTTALEGASFIDNYDRGQARAVAAQLRPGATGLDETLARLVAVREGINIIVDGSVSRQAAGYRLSIKAIDSATGKEVAARELEAKDGPGILAGVGRLAAPIRRAMGDSTPESVQVAAAETFTTTSLEAAHNYGRAQDLQMLGKWQEALPFYEQTIQQDPKCGRAYAGMAAMYANLNRRLDAEKYYKLAMANIDRMTDREKYRTRGSYYLAMRNPEKAAEQFGELVKLFPSDRAGFANLAMAYFYGRNMPRALETGRRAVEISPKSVGQRNNLALYALYAGDFSTAEREAREVMKLSSTFEQAYGTLAAAQLGQGKVAEAIETYRQMQALSPRGATLAATGLADLAVFEGRLADAKGVLEKGIVADLADKNRSAAAEKQAALAYVIFLRGERASAIQAADRALAGSKADIIQFTAARVYVESGQEAQARGVAAAFSQSLEPDPQAYGKLIEGEIQIKRGAPREALRSFQEAQKLADTWLGRFALGRAYLALEAYTEADTELDQCLKRRGETTSIFLDDVPTYRYLPPVYYYLGRARHGLGSAGAPEAYQTFLSFKKGGEDPLVADARRRLNAR